VAWTKQIKPRIFLEVENLFNTKIPRFINSYTGEPYDPGKPVAYSYINRPNPNYDPSRYYQPRTILLGVSFRY